MIKGKLTRLLKGTTALLLTCFLLAGAKPLAAQTTGTVKSNDSFPVFTIQTLEGKMVSTASFRKPGRHTIIMYFSPTCSHCRAQTEQITGNIKLFDKADWLMVSAYPDSEIQIFIKDMGLAPFKNITVAHDPQFALGQFLALDEIPGIFVYSPNGKLLKQIRKATTAEKIAEAMR